MTMMQAPMSLDVAVVMDPIGKIKIGKDSTFAMLLEAARRGHRLHYVLPGGLWLDAERPMARVAPLQVRDDPADWFTLGEAVSRPLAALDVVLMRTDPPVDANYLHDTLVLSLAQAAGVLVVNDPAGLRDLNEKLGALLFPQCCPPTRVSRSAAELRAVEVAEQDYLTRWAIDYLNGPNDTSLPAMLEAAMDRRFSANPGEQFFTGGGLHVFNNFKKTEDLKVPTMYQALQDSINLPFVRLMRDIVNYSSSMQNEGNMARLLRNDKDPRREEYLRVFADREGNTFVTKFYRKYKKVAPNERLELFFDGQTQAEQQLTAAYRYLQPNESIAAFKAFLQQRLPQNSYTDKRIKELYNKYGPEKYNLPDQGYIARVHPLELWVLDYLNQHPEANLNDVKEASKDERQAT